MPTGALRQAIRNYFRDTTKPSSIPGSLTQYEWHPVEEESLPEVYAIRAKSMDAEPGQGSKGGKSHGEPGHPSCEYRPGFETGILHRSAPGSIAPALP